MKGINRCSTVDYLLWASVVMFFRLEIYSRFLSLSGNSILNKIFNMFNFSNGGKLQGPQGVASEKVSQP